MKERKTLISYMLNHIEVPVVSCIAIIA